MAAVKNPLFEGPAEFKLAIDEISEPKRVRLLKAIVETSPVSEAQAGQGGIVELVELLEDEGFQAQLESWTRPAENLRVPIEGLVRVLHSPGLANLTSVLKRDLELDDEVLAVQLSEILPSLVHELAPVGLEAIRVTAPIQIEGLKKRLAQPSRLVSSGNS